MELSGTELLIRVAGSAALLLWGARMMRTGMIRAYGGEIRSILAACTDNRIYCLVAGAFSAGVLQSSTAVALFTTSFAALGALSVADGLAIMLGADLGSALVTFLLALDIRSIWPVLMLGGYIMHAWFEKRRPIIKQAGRVAMGLGLVFLALTILSSTSSILNQSNLLRQLLSGLANEPIIAFIVGALLTWFAHSSIVVLLLVAGLAESGLLSEGTLALTLVLGINAGAALPAFALTYRDKPPARQITLGNLIFRVTGALIALAAMPLWADYLTNGAASGGQVILAHILFNVLLLAVFVGATGYLANALARLNPLESVQEDDGAPRYLSETAKEMPSMALNLAARETLRMSDMVDLMVTHCANALDKNDTAEADSACELEEQVDRLYEAIKFYVTDIEREETDVSERRKATEIITFTTHLESAGDVIDRNLIDTIRQKITAGGSFSKAGAKELDEIFAFVGETIRLASSVFMDPKIDAARALIARKDELRQLELKSTKRHLTRLRRRKPQAVATSSFHLDIIRDLKRVNSHFTSVGYPILESSGGLRASRLKKA
ncbi:MAG: Na/Pi cotransporter family protein [Hyphomicrobiales bacterium]